MLNKLRLNVNLWGMYDELFILSKKQKELYKKFKTRNKDEKINKEVEDAIFSLIYAPTTLENHINLEDHYYDIENSIPKYMKKKKKDELSDVHKLYIELLSIIKYNFEYPKEYQHAIKKQSFPNTNIYDLLGNVDEIQSNFTQDIIDDLLDVLTFSKDKVKIDLAIKILMLAKESIDLEIISILAVFIKNTDNLDKLEDINTIIGKVYYIKGKDFVSKSYKFIKLIINKKDGEYYEDLLKETINTLFNTGIVISYLEPTEIELLCYILKREHNINEKNINTIISIISDKNFYCIKDKDIRNNILNTLLTINILGDKIYIYKKYMLNIYARCQSNRVKEYLLEKLNEIKSIKSLKLIVDIYPDMISHIEIEDTNKLIDNIVEFENLDSTKKKELVIPIKYDK